MGALLTSGVYTPGGNKEGTPPPRQIKQITEDTLKKKTKKGRGVRCCWVNSREKPGGREIRLRAPKGAHRIRIVFAKKRKRRKKTS